MTVRQQPLSHMGRYALEKHAERLEAELALVYDNLKRVQTNCTDQLIAIRGMKYEKIDEQVRAFHDVMGIENRETLGVPSDDVVRLRMRLVIEEAFELLLASSSGPYYERLRFLLTSTFNAIDDVDLEPDLVEVADACADLDYVVAGTRLAYGIDRQVVADEVHRSNMAKAPGGKIYRDDRGKITKPPGWTPPDIKGVLGFKRHEIPKRECTCNGYGCDPGGSGQIWNCKVHPR